MCTCEFCGTQFQPRPQVKKPRACPAIGCQSLRQRSNERSWHSRYLHLYDRKYFADMKMKRSLAIQLKTEELIRWLDIGSRFLAQTLNLSALRDIFLNFCHRVGIRKINKLWVT